MKKILCIIIVLSLLPSCSKDSVYDETDGLVVPVFNEWGASFDDVKAGISENKVISSSDNEILFRADDENSIPVYVAYQFVNGKLTASVVFFSSDNAEAVTNRYVQDFSYIGNLSNVDVYENTTSNTLCISYIQDEFRILGFSELVVTSAGPTEGEQNGHKWVDLGLSSGTKWATMDVGASAEGTYGKYYSWGALNSSSPTCWNDYVYFQGVFYGNMQLKDIGSNISGKSQYDVATYAWGSPWKMPTLEQCKELCEDCTLDASGSTFVITGPNGNSICFPKSGSYGHSGSYNCTWTSNSAGYLTASYLYIQNGNQPLFKIVTNASASSPNGMKYYGYTVRPVM